MDNIYQNLHSNQKIVIYEMLTRGITVEVVDETREIIKCTYGEHIEYLYDRDSSIIPYNMSIIAGDKALTKNILIENNINVPLGVSFPAYNFQKFIDAFHILNCPVTIKPVNGSHGYDVYTNIQTEEELLKALNNLIEHRGNTETLIEEYIDALEYRIFITKNDDYAVLLRDCAHVYGDGIHTLKELIAQENYQRFHPRTNALCEILVDEEMHKYLKKKNLTLDTIPKNNEKVYLRPNSNVAMGGVCVDYTDKIHPSVIENAKKILKCFPGLPYIGIDYMTNHIDEYQTEDNYYIIEVNTVPGIHMHYRPGIGKSRNIAKYIVDLIYPETKLERSEKNERQKSLRIL